MDKKSVVDPGFCSNCQAIFPMIVNSGNITCAVCKSDYSCDAFGTMEASYTIHFNSRGTYQDQSVEEEAGGPVVERRCAKCGNDKMSYATLQLRSADEGQTVFYTCTKCKYKETENS